MDDFTQIKPGQYIDRYQTYTDHYDPTDYWHNYIKNSIEEPKAWGSVGRDGCWHITQPNDILTIKIKETYSDPIVTLKCKRLYTYVEGTGDCEDGFTMYKIFYHEILEVLEVIDIDESTRNTAVDVRDKVESLEIDMEVKRILESDKPNIEMSKDEFMAIPKEELQAKLKEVNYILVKDGRFTFIFYEHYWSDKPTYYIEWEYYSSNDSFSYYDDFDNFYKMIHGDLKANIQCEIRLRRDAYSRARAYDD